jgi:hypothetical protein
MNAKWNLLQLEPAEVRCQLVVLVGYPISGIIRSADSPKPTRPTEMRKLVWQGLVISGSQTRNKTEMRQTVSQFLDDAQ